jgi:dihydroorotate dehydrogenase
MVDALWPMFRWLLFRLDAETAHEWTFGPLGAAPDLWGQVLGGLRGANPSQPFEVAGLTFRGPVGLAAGLDKNGVGLPVWDALGFGFIEVGTVTAHPQPGNPRPRLFRLPEERALINRLGFNNQGSEALAVRLRERRERDQWPKVPVGVNIGKSKVTPLSEAPDDYVTSVHRLRGLADYFTVNVSSPNTAGLRDLQSHAHLQKLLPPVVAAARDTPVFLKLAPDLENEELTQAATMALSEGIAGLIATNTTVRRDALQHDPRESGGLSGPPLHELARSKIQHLLQHVDSRFPIIGVGGIENASQVSDMLTEGCAAVQLYTSFIYEGPGLPARIHRQLAARP